MFGSSGKGAWPQPNSGLGWVECRLDARWALREWTPVIEVEDMPAFPGLHVPDELWWAKGPPVPFAGMTHPPGHFDWEQAAAMGFRAVICLTGDDPGCAASDLRRARSVRPGTA